MSSPKSDQAPADYVAMALSPALIMALVGSLIFFLLEILYAGAHIDRLKWILFFFIFGAVLVARISMRPDIAPRAHLYGGLLGVLTWVGANMYVEYPPGTPAAEFAWAINLGLIALAWWCARQLTWDCTFMDDRVGGSGKGVLQAAGLEDGGRPQPEEEEEEDADKPQDEPSDWIERYQQYRKKRSKSRTPGVWVVYFSLAALPIFGIGQSLIPPDEVARRRYTFWLMGVYVAAGLGLLLTTTFLGLRMYLQRRRLRMPAAMTGAWMAVGVGLIAVLLLGGALLPRPNAEVRLVDIGPVEPEQRQASQINVKGGEPGKDKGDTSGGREGNKGEGTPVKEKGGEKPGDQKDKGGGGDSKDKDGQGGEKDRSGARDKGDRKDQSDSGSRDGAKDAKDSTDKKDRNQDDQQKDSQSGSGSGERKDGKDSGPSRGGGSTPPSRPLGDSLPEWTKKVGAVLKWVVLVALAILVVFFVLRAVLQFCANFSDFAKNLLESFRRLWESILALFSWGARPRDDVETDPGVVGSNAPPAPFRSFSNPFDDGRGESMPVAELVRYSFSALQSWAWERDLARQPGETPLEFADRLGEGAPPLAREAQRLASLYARCVYARGGLPANARAVAERFWETLARATEQPLSA